MSCKIWINFKEKGLQKNLENRYIMGHFGDCFRDYYRPAMTYVQGTGITTIKDANEYPTSATFCSFFMQRLASVKAKLIYQLLSDTLNYNRTTKSGNLWTCWIGEIYIPL